MWGKRIVFWGVGKGQLICVKSCYENIIKILKLGVDVMQICTSRGIFYAVPVYLSVGSDNKWEKLQYIVGFFLVIYGNKKEI